MSFTILVHEKADEELSHAYEWYEGQKSGLGEQFLKELGKQTSLLQSNPYLFQITYKNYRTAALKTFPYLIIFEIEETIIIIYSIFHTSRNPKIWKTWTIHKLK